MYLYTRECVCNSGPIRSAKSWFCESKSSVLLKLCERCRARLCLYKYINLLPLAAFAGQRSSRESDRDKLHNDYSHIFHAHYVQKTLPARHRKIICSKRCLFSPREPFIFTSKTPNLQTEHSSFMWKGSVKCIILIFNSKLHAFLLQGLFSIVIEITMIYLTRLYKN